MTRRMAERTKIVKAHSKYDVLRTSVPAGVKKQWKLKAGDELEWEWEARDNEMVLVVKKAGKS